MGAGELCLRGVSICVIHLVQGFCLLPRRARDECGEWD